MVSYEWTAKEGRKLRAQWTGASGIGVTALLAPPNIAGFYSMLFGLLLPFLLVVLLIVVCLDQRATARRLAFDIAALWVAQILCGLVSLFYNLLVIPALLPHRES